MATLGILSLLVPLLVIAAIVTGVVVLINKKTDDSISRTVVVRDTLLELFKTVTLYLSLLGVLLVIWSLADFWFPEFPEARSDAVRPNPELVDPIDPAPVPPGARSAPLETGPMRAGIAMAVVAFPIFAALVIYARKRQSAETVGLRQVFAYLNLFVVMVTVMVNVMVVINVYLNGDLTPRFAVRATGVLLVAGLVYLYYRSESVHDHEGAAVVSSKQPERQT